MKRACFSRTSVINPKLRNGRPRGRDHLVSSSNTHSLPPSLPYHVVLVISMWWSLAIPAFSCIHWAREVNNEEGSTLPPTPLSELWVLSDLEMGETRVVFLVELSSFWPFITPCWLCFCGVTISISFTIGIGNANHSLQLKGQ